MFNQERISKNNLEVNLSPDTVSCLILKVGSHQPGLVEQVNLSGRYWEKQKKANILTKLYIYTFFFFIGAYIFLYNCSLWNSTGYTGSVKNSLLSPAMYIS